MIMPQTSDNYPNVKCVYVCVGGGWFYAKTTINISHLG